MTEQKAKKILYVLISVSALIRIIAAVLTELGNDEVYYWTYALFPSLSYFDHPPMVGYLIRLTTFNLSLNYEVFVRLGSIIIGSANLYIIYKIGEKIKNPLTGLYAAFLYTSSIYGFVITGIFILPDTPQVLFWLLSLSLLISSITKNPDTFTRKKMLLAGITIGLAMLSKYHSVFLWFGAGLYILFYNRLWLKSKEFYIAVITSFIIFIPVLVWNSQNDFISFTFQSGRVSIFSTSFNINTFFQEFFGQVFYNNPVNYIIIIIALIMIIRGKVETEQSYKRFLLLTGLPIIIIFLFFSLTRSTFPHWSAPGYFSLILLASIYLSGKPNPPLIPVSIKIALSVTLLIVSLAVLQLNIGLINLSKQENNTPEKLGRNDVTLEMYGWKQIGKEFRQIYKNNYVLGTMPADAPVIAHKWYDAAHIEYYAAYPLRLRVLAFNDLTDIRNYHWLNKKRRPLQIGDNMYYITATKDFKSPEIYKEYFDKIETPDTIKVFRGNDIVEYAYVYKMLGLKKIPAY